MSFVDLLASCKVLPVVTALDAESTVQLSEALYRGGMTAVEITLRTPAALDSIREVRRALPDMLVGAGTVTSLSSLEQAQEAGADFFVSPGMTESLLQAANSRGAMLLPGVATATELMLGMEHGLDVFKLFPAEAVGGINLLRSLAGPFPGVRFCPTGGLGPSNFSNYLALPNVICCGGSWMVREELVTSGNWDEIERLTREALQLDE